MNKVVNTAVIRDALEELLRISLGIHNSSFDFNILSETDWHELMNEANAQAVGMMCFDAAFNSRLPMPNNVYNEWLKYSMAVIAEGVKVQQGRSKLIKLLTENNIDYVILKGASCEYYYPKEDMRMVGDIDFLVSPSDIEKTKKLLIDCDYNASPDLNDIHYEFNKNDVRFELHKTVAGIPDGKIGQMFSEELERIMEYRVYSDKYDIYKPSDYHHGIVILLHSIHHMFYNGIGMRQLCDWAFFVRETHKKEFWTNKLIPLLKKTGTLKYALSLTGVCISIFRLPTPNWYEPVQKEMQGTIIKEIYNCGNFGIKRSEEIIANVIATRDGKKLTVSGKIRQMLRNLNNTNEKAFPILKKAPYLYPFIMIYRIFRYLVLMILGKKPSLLKASRQATKKNNLFLEYGLFNPEDN